MRDLVIAIGGLMQPGENRKAWLTRVADAAGLHPRIVRAAFHQEPTSRIAAAKLKAAAENETSNIARQFDELAATVEMHASAIPGQHADWLRSTAREIRRKCCAPGSAPTD